MFIKGYEDGRGLDGERIVGIWIGESFIVGVWGWLDVEVCGVFRDV